LIEEHGKSGTLPSPARRKNKTKEDKPLTLPEQRLAAALDDTSSSRSPSPPPPPTHAEEQVALRAETIAAFHVSAGEAAKQEEEEEGGLFTLREKTRDEIEQEEAVYRAYLEREVGPLEEILDLGEEGKAESEVRRQEDDDTHARPAEAETGKKKKKKKGRKSEEDRKETDQEFLIKCVCRFSRYTQQMTFYFFRSYILNRGWVDRAARRLPTYKEITAHASSSKDAGPSATHTVADADAGANNDLLEEDEFEEVAEHFESSYNFRFEEPDAAHIQSFPRAVESVRRRTEHAERRRAARERRQERKEAEKAQRREEVKRLKGLKARELETKLERIGKEGGWARSQGLSFLPPLALSY
jgi:protein KRI1